MAWTPEQLKAISQIDKNVLVSASAGSGKTAVMVERAAKIIVEKKVPISELLIVTFATDAAAEIKQRLYIKLAESLNNPKADKSFIIKQLDSIDTGYVCTLHSFCLDLVRMYFYDTDLDPQFTVMEQDDSNILKSNVLSSLLSDKLTSGDSGIVDLMEIFTTVRNDKNFKQMLLDLYEFLMAEDDYKSFLDNRFCMSDGSSAQLINYGTQLFAYECAMFKVEAERCEKSFDGLRLAKCLQAAQILSKNLQLLSKCKTISDLQLTGDKLEAAGQVDRSTDKMSAEQLAVISQFSVFKAKVNKFISTNLSDLLTANQSSAEFCNAAAAHLKSIATLMIEFVDRFAAAKRSENVIDFSDFEHYALSILRNSEICLSVKKRFKYIFVDEYQDTSRVQEAILRLISDNNLFTVGDVKQSIYAFRRCEIESFVSREKLYTARNDCGEVIYLNRNFRSQMGVLEFCDNVMERTMTENFGGANYRENGKFVYGAEYPLSTGCRVEVTLALPSEDEAVPRTAIYDIEEELLTAGEEQAVYEGEIIAKYIAKYEGSQIYDIKKKATRAATLGDIVILTRNMGAYTMGVKNYIETHYSIPIATSVLEQSQDVNLLVDLLSVIDNMRQDLPLAAIMRSSFGDFSNDELAQIKILYASSGKTSKFFYSAVEYVADIDGLLSDKLREFLLWLGSLNKMITFASLAEVLSAAIEIKNFDSFVLSQKYGVERYEYVSAYLAMLEKSKYKFNLSGYLSDLKNGKTIDFSDNLKSGGGAVRMSTIHKVKGLEFPIVIYMGVGRSYNMADIRKRLLIDKDFGGCIDKYDIENQLKYENPLKKILARKIKIDLLGEELRLMYVAMTRAQNYLLISGRMKKVKEERAYLPSNVSCALDFLQQTLKEHCDSSEYSYTILTDFDIKRSLPSSAKQVDFTLFDEKEVNRLIKQLDITYKYKDSNLSQKYTVTGVSAPKIAEEDMMVAKELYLGDQAEIGNIYHKILERCDMYNPSMQNIRGIYDDLIAKKLFSADTAVELQLVLDCLNSDLMVSLRNYKIYREKEFMLYVSPCEVGLDGNDKVLVQGKIDCLAVQNDEAVIIDFKSGKVGSAIIAEERYGKQLKLYALAVEKVLKLSVKGAIIYSLGAKKHFYCS